MSQSPYAQLGPDAGAQYPYGPELIPTDPGRTSILAIVALVLAICGCVCPVLLVPGALAMVLGGISIILIAMSNWRNRGVGIAITAICLGMFQCVVMALLFFGIYQPVMGGWRSVVVGPVGNVLTNIDKGDLAAARAGLTPHAQTLITEEMLADFGKRYDSRIGKFQEFPSGVLDIWQTYRRIAPAFRALGDGSGQPNTQNIIPLPGRFANGDALVIMQMDQGQLAKRRSRTGNGGWSVTTSNGSTTTTTTSSGVPLPTGNAGQWQMPVLNIGIATTDGKVEWLIDPDVARKSGRTPPPGPPPGGGPGGPPGAGGPDPMHPPVVRPDHLDAETGAIRMTANLPFNIMLQKDVLHELVINDERRIIGGGPSKFGRDEFPHIGDDSSLLVRRFAVLEGKMLVQVRMDDKNSRFGLASEGAEGLDLDKPIVIVDDHDKATPAVGFVGRIDADVWISYHPDAPLKSMHETGMPSISRDHPKNELVMLFQVDSGTNIAEIRIGERTLVKFDPPLEAKWSR